MPWEAAAGWSRLTPKVTTWLLTSIPPAVQWASRSCASPLTKTGVDCTRGLALTSHQRGLLLLFRNRPIIPLVTSTPHRPKRVLVACEFSGIVRDAFADVGCEAWSCDLLPSEKPGNHLQCNVLDCLFDGWDLMIAHPPCTHLAVSGARHFHRKVQQQAAALHFVSLLLSAPIRQIALENPVSVISSRIRKPDQIVQPWWFGHGETKATCLWLKRLPLLEPTDIVDGRMDRIHKMPPSPDRWKNRSRTYTGLAAAMAAQWGAW